MKMPHGAASHAAKVRESMIIMAEKVRGVSLPYLKAWRLHRMMTQGELVERSGLARSTVARAEAGREVVSFPNIRRLADTLGITPEQLVNEDPVASRS
jgi:DNA-binding Xre family transcriptional regulator